MMGPLAQTGWTPPSLWHWGPALMARNDPKIHEMMGPLAPNGKDTYKRNFHMCNFGESATFSIILCCGSDDDLQTNK